MKIIVKNFMNIESGYLDGIRFAFNQMYIRSSRIHNDQTPPI